MPRVATASAAVQEGATMQHWLLSSAAVMHNGVHGMYAQQLLPAGCWPAGMPTGVSSQHIVIALALVPAQRGFSRASGATA